MGSLTNIHNLQKQAIRIVSKAGYLAHHIPLCYNLNILDLPDIYNVRALSFFYDYFHGTLPPSLLSMFSLQYTKDVNLLIKTSYRRTDIAAASLTHTLPNIWNPLPDKIKLAINKSKTKFLTAIKKHYVTSYEDWVCVSIDCYSCNQSSQ